MDDLIALLERTTPSVAPPNVARLTRRARARRGRRLAFAVIPLLLLVASAIALRPATGGHVTTAGAPQLGTWRRTSPPPLDLSSQVRTVTLSDSRVVVVAGSFDALMPAHPFETALYDASTDHWTRLAAAPVASNRAGADLLAANDTALLLTHDDNDNVSAAALDLHTLQWRSIAIPAASGHAFNAWAWDGTTLVLARLGYDPDRTTSGPAMLERWNADTNAWRPGAAPPIAARFLPVVARSTHQLAIWGGYTLDPHALGSVPIPVPAGGVPTTVGSRPAQLLRALTDGAIYDIDRDAWTYLPPESSLADMATRGAQGLLTPATLTLVSSQVDGTPRVAARYEHGSWRQLPSPSAHGFMNAAQPETGTIAISSVNESGPQPAQYIDGTANSWQDAPAYQLARGPRGLLAISATSDGPGNSALSVWQLDGDTWTPTTPAPFADRMEPGLGVVGNQLLVIGGQQGPNLRPQQDAWLVDLTPTQ